MIIIEMSFYRLRILRGRSERSHRKKEEQKKKEKKEKEPNEYNYLSSYGLAFVSVLALLSPALVSVHQRLSFHDKRRSGPIFNYFSRISDSRPTRKANSALWDEHDRKPGTNRLITNMVLLSTSPLRPFVLFVSFMISC